jgi:hypothetical protein
VLTSSSVNYTNVEAPAGSVATIKVGNETYTSFDAKLTPDGRTSMLTVKPKSIQENHCCCDQSCRLSCQSRSCTNRQTDGSGLLVILVMYVTMVYGPIAAMLVEMFPTRIRYTSMSLPYHIGNGWFGGLLPTTAFALVAFKGDIYYGLWYPIIIALATFVIGVLFVRETKDNDIYSQD